MSSFDAIIIGTGQAAPALAGRLTQAGMKIAVVERKYFGGTCVNTGCMPTKTLVASAEVAHKARRAADFGVDLAPGVRVDMKRIKARKDAVSTASRIGTEKHFRGMTGCTVYEGHARFESSHGVRVGNELLAAERIFINTGGRAVVPDMPGLDTVPYLTNSSMMDVDFLPRHLAIVGGSYVSLEFAQMYRRFGSEVTVIERGPRLASREDPDVSDALKGILEAEGVTVRLGAECLSVSGGNNGVSVNVSCDAGAKGSADVRASHLLMAVGRRPNTDDLGLEEAGVTTDKRGYILVDDALRTNVPGIWALGDCNGRGAFTHTSYNDFEVVAANILDGESRSVTDRIPAYALVRGSTPGQGRVDGSRGEGAPHACPHGQETHDAREQGGGKGRDAGIHEGHRQRGDETHSRCRGPGNRRGRGDSLHPGRHVRGGSLHGSAEGGAHPPDRVRAHSHDAGRDEASRSGLKRSRAALPGVYPRTLNVPQLLEVLCLHWGLLLAGSIYPQRGCTKAPGGGFQPHPVSLEARPQGGGRGTVRAGQAAHMIVHLVDGTYELFRCYYGIKRSTKPDDGNGAVRLVLHTLLQMVEEGATHFGVATDHVIESFRNGLWPGYKTGEGVEPALLAQFHPLEDGADGIRICRVADGRAGGGRCPCLRGGRRGRQHQKSQKVCIWTPDKDLAQCVAGDRVVQVDRRGGHIRDEAAVMAKFGVPPASIPDYLALVGDSADGYPGIPGWGAKSAAAVLSRYGHLADIPIHEPEWRPPAAGAGRLAESLRSNWEQALLFLKLATLRTDAKLFGAVEELQWKGPLPEAEKFARRIGAESLLARAREAAARI